MKDQDKIMYYKNKYNITNFTTYQDLRHAIYCYEMKNFVDLVYSVFVMVDVLVMLFLSIEEKLKSFLYSCHN
jgi:hypothetical protein